MRFALIVTLVLTGSACDHNELVGCVNNTQCPEGNICDAGRCEKVCSNDIDCARGYICIDSICEQGVRNDAPTITGVVGNGSQSCTDSPDDRCFADAIIIQGAHLLGSSFRLDNQGTGPSFTNLTIGSQNTDDQVEIELPTDLATGSYFLVAANGAGSDQGDVQILQGEPGDPGPALTGQEMLTAINTGATGMFLVARLPNANALLTHLNDGDGSVVLGTHIAPGDGGSGGGTMTGTQIVAAINGSLARIDSDNLYVGTTSADISAGDHLHPIYALADHTHAGGGTMTGADIVTAINAATGSRIDADNITTGTSGTSVALGNHGHTGYANSTHNHAGTDITSDVPIAHIPTGTSGTTVAFGNHTHSGSGGIARLEYGPVAPGASVPVTQADINSMCDDDNGCRIRIGITGFGIFDGSWYFPGGILWGPDCNVHTDGADWVVGYACAHIYSIPTGTYQPYISHIFGTDGDGDDGAPRLLGYNAGGSTAAWVCNLQENADSGDDDDGYAFSTVSAGVANYFDRSTRRCHLVIED